MNFIVGAFGIDFIIAVVVGQIAFVAIWLLLLR